MEDCLFCKIINGEISSNKVYEDDDFYAFFDAYPVTLGHTLVVPKKHYANLFELPDDVTAKYLVTVKKIANAIKKTINADGINIEMNNLPAADQVIFHSHIHIIPRFDNDNIVHMWNNESKDGKAVIDPEKLKETISKIQENL